MQEPSPYAAPNAAVEMPESNGELRLAGRGERLAAAIVDALLGFVVVLTVVVPVVLLTGVWRAFVDMVMRGEQMPLWWALGMSFGGFLLNLLVQGYPLAAAGQTWGKRLLKLRIVDRQGSKPEFARLIALRYGVTWVLSVVPVFGPLYSIVDCLFIFRDDKRCIHDHIAGTRVVVAD